MTEHFYENHSKIRQDKLCPIKISFVKNHFDYFCNWHENLEILLISGGEGAIIYGSEEFTLCEGDIVVVNSDALHRIYSKTGVDYLYIIIDESFCLENGISTRERSFTRTFRSQETERLLFELAEVYAKYRHNPDPAATLTAEVRFALLALLLDLCKSHSETTVTMQKGEKSSDRYVKRVISYMGEHYNEPLSLDSLAELCGISKHHLAREFKRYTSYTVLTYLNIIRTKNAEVFMAEGMSVTEAAFECGFESLSYFSRTYKKIMGVSPSKNKSSGTL